MFKENCDTWTWWCERCGSTKGLTFESSRTCYPEEEDEITKGRRQKLRMLEIERDPKPDPNRDVILCRECAVEHHEFWDEMWAEYYHGRL